MSVTPARPAPARILMVDDNRVNLDLQRRLLADEPWQISVATCAEEALRVLEQQRPDLILLDILMPGMDGIELCRRIKGMEQLANVPVIFLTADAQDATRGFSAGAVDYIVKPVQGPELACRIRLHLELQSMMGALRRQVIEHERLASLGEMVSVIGHELGTPLGVCVTALSTLAEAERALRRRYDGQHLSSRQLESFLDTVVEGVQLALENVAAANELMSGMKELAVDQSSERQRTIALRAYVGKLVRSLEPRIRAAGAHVELHIPEDLRLSLMPGDLAQILRNLIVNSLIHGFGDRGRGTIEIRAMQSQDGWRLRYRDDGRGIPACIRDRVFEKFVTSAGESGGSGLGMYIVKQSAESLGGEVRLVETGEPGAVFEFRFPPAAAAPPATEPALRALRC